MKLNELIIGKTVVDVQYIAYKLVSIVFEDGSVLDIHQTQQAGALDIYYGAEIEVTADNQGDD